MLFCCSDTETQCEVMQEIVDLILEVSSDRQVDRSFMFDVNSD